MLQEHIPDISDTESSHFFDLGIKSRVLYKDIEQLEIPTSKVEVIPERGGKSRIVSKSPGSLVALAHQIRKFVLGLLRKVPECHWTLDGDRRKAVEKIFSKEVPRHWYILSADLSKASDCIQFQASKAIWSGIQEGLKTNGYECPEWFTKTISLCTGPQRLLYPDNSVIDTTCGVLMGLPLTWITLSIL
jgi:hypothetical protein